MESPRSSAHRVHRCLAPRDADHVELDHQHAMLGLLGRTTAVRGEEHVGELKSRARAYSPKQHHPGQVPCRRVRGIARPRGETYMGSGGCACCSGNPRESSATGFSEQAWSPCGSSDSPGQPNHNPCRFQMGRLRASPEVGTTGKPPRGQSGGSRGRADPETARYDLTSPAIRFRWTRRPYAWTRKSSSRCGPEGAPYKSRAQQKCPVESGLRPEAALEWELLSPSAPRPLFTRVQLESGVACR